MGEKLIHEDKIEKEFHDKAIIDRRIYLFCPFDALAVVRRCRELHKEIYGIDAFLLKNNGQIQPVMAQSIDYSDPDANFSDTSVSDQGHWNEASQFINDRMNTDYVFEIVYARE